ncbi:tyrosine-type recombinase/integrase [Cupriavidus pauculus]|uniref:tyrosine-type recombinase/integrase n=1 Tax=Cupriavidus pauculus TaxID=82633 RepID=UPI0012FE4332|nr:tyrosine-type recombinase/integrase [Cupriavidus pauculus]
MRYITLTQHRIAVENGEVIHVPACGEDPIEGFPQLMWRDGTPWREANIYALTRLRDASIKLATVQTSASNLLRYAKWLEVENVQWWYLPRHKKRERCLNRFRKSLIDARDKGHISPTTASQTMSQVIAFYRWLYANGFLSDRASMWTEKSHVIPLVDKVGAERAIVVQSTDLAIKCRPLPGLRLEDGLLPVSSIDRDRIIALAMDFCSEELFLMLTLGFFTGMRIGSIATLRINTLEHAIPDPRATGVHQLALGPGANPPVTTKYSITGHAIILEDHLNVLRKYAYSPRRLKREAKAEAENKDLLFLTRYGNCYTTNRGEKSSSLNVEMHHLREIGNRHGVAALRDFHFHQSRCTFATIIAKIMAEKFGEIAAIGIVQELLLHKSEGQSMKYVKFASNSKMLLELSNEFTRQFLGLGRKV